MQEWQLVSTFDPKPQNPSESETLKTVRVREFGALALFYSLAQKLELIDLINLCVPQAPPGR